MALKHSWYVARVWLRRLAAFSAIAGCDPWSLDGYADGQLTTSTSGVGGGTDSSFAARCAAPGVLRCFAFDDEAELLAYYTPPGTTVENLASVDTTEKASGRGSMMLSVPAGSREPSVAGEFAINFTPDSKNRNKLNDPPPQDYYSVGIAEGQTVYVQWRQRFEQQLLDGSFVEKKTNTALQTFFVGKGDSPDRPSFLEESPSFSLTNDQYRGVVGATGVFPVTTQGPAGEQIQNVTGCRADAFQGPECVRFLPNEWMTFQIAMTVGTASTPTTRLQVWVGAESFPKQAVIDQSDQLTGDADVYGKLYFALQDRLLPFGATRSATRCWVDELIISREAIADP